MYVRKSIAKTENLLSGNLQVDAVSVTYCWGRKRCRKWSPGFSLVLFGKSVTRRKGSLPGVRLQQTCLANSLVADNHTGYCVFVPHHSISFYSLILVDNTNHTGNCFLFTHHSISLYQTGKSYPSLHRIFCFHSWLANFGKTHCAFRSCFLSWFYP